VVIQLSSYKKLKELKKRKNKSIFRGLNDLHIKLEANKIASSNFLFFQFLYRNNKNNNYFSKGENDGHESIIRN